MAPSLPAAAAKYQGSVGICASLEVAEAAGDHVIIITIIVVNGICALAHLSCDGTCFLTTGGLNRPNC